MIMKNNREKVLSEHQLFSISQPGYFFSEVEEAIEDYKAELSEQIEAMHEKDQKIAKYASEIERLKDEMFELQLQLNISSEYVETPSVDEAREILLMYGEQPNTPKPKLKILGD